MLAGLAYNVGCHYIGPCILKDGIDYRCTLKVRASFGGLHWGLISGSLGI
jgi:hypothetical protein